MDTGFRGTFVISWTQTEVDGLGAAPLSALVVGAAWTWRGDVVRVDGPQDVLRLDGANGQENMRRRAARSVHRLVGAATAQQATPPMALEAPMTDSSFVVTDGVKSFTVTVIPVGRGRPPLLMFLDDLPPRDADLWVVHHAFRQDDESGQDGSGGGVICFTPGTLIDTPQGPRAVEDLREGDRVHTQDSGAQDILWIGSRRMTGARLFAMPHLRPVRLERGALGGDHPSQPLLVSPDHRMLVKGDVARDLFNTPEVLVAAKDLVDGQSITVAQRLREVTYVHLLLLRHEILWANGVATESFHPASAALSSLSDADRDRLLEQIPVLGQDPNAYGDHARRSLSASEAAVLQYAA
ncbi:MAG: Hint domain-containing protein [Pseudomonadota bacterium]